MNTGGGLDLMTHGPFFLHLIQNRMGKTRDLFKKIGITKVMFQIKIGPIKDKNGKNLTEEEDVKKRWQEYTEKLNKKALNDRVNRIDVGTHLEPDILKCEIKWALESLTTNKVSGGDGILAELFQILKDDVSDALIMPTNLENSAVVIGQEKVSFHSGPKEKQCQIMFRLPHSCTHFTG